MSGLTRIATAALLVASFGSIAEAQARRDPPVASNDYYGLSEGRSAAFDRPTDIRGVVPPSETRTVMGLRVPR